MRHSCFFAVTATITLGLSGCGPDSSGDDGYLNPATDVDLPLTTFRLQDTEGLAPVLQYTIFRDFYRGIQPATDGEDAGIAQALREHLNPFLGATPGEDGTDYTSVRNPLDLINEVIRSGIVDNFNEGRQLMRDSVNKDEAASYNTPANDALIRFTESDSDSDVPAADRTWIYPMLDWTNTPNLGKIFRATQYVARQPAEGEENPAELASASWSGRYDASSFGTSGFNQPEFAAASLAGRTRGNVELLQEFIGTQRDTLTLTQARGIVIRGEEPDCIRVVLNYYDQRVQVFTSKDEPPTLEDNGERTANPDHCGNQQNGEEAESYHSIAIAHRQ
ncbi:hypothetical protein EHN06_00580 [Marinobacter sp. NP-4(2019)]|uniref:hypothetical protein n=1 Tax=Marinobacter sp. NP-4(2019) TaxID=2488665 RepID=UPI000FC3DFDC|nr:hypothetical protein [Marinobacter sp. NP-4(2019)]AZT82163.1 hypothetical protein EHN06_00580 [Marinobacter sp. NP-4(2019)]